MQKQRRLLSVIVLVAALTCPPAVIAAQATKPGEAPRPSYPPRLPDAKVETYKTVGDVRLQMFLYFPDDHRPSHRRPAIVFFFGGGWSSGTPEQFRPQARYLVSRGMVAMLADYRVASRHGVKATACIEDAKSAIRWTRKNAQRLGVDPDRIVAAGGSAGGHLAAATATISEFEPPGEDLSISSAPNANVLFNPAVLLAPITGNLEPGIDLARGVDLQNRFGADPKRVSPYHHARKGTVPTIIFHGKADSTVPYRTVEIYCRHLQTLGNRCELVGYNEYGHGFFNYQREDKKPYYDTVRRMDRFLASLGFIQGEPTIREAR